MIYQGIVSSDAKIYFEGSDNGVSWQPLNFKTEKGITNEDSFHPVFNWQEYITDAKVRFIKISSSMQGQMIGEVGVFSPDGDIYDLYAPDGENELIDEQDKVVYSPSYLNSTYFDEIYHARTAYEIINSLPIYENTSAAW